MKFEYLSCDSFHLSHSHSDNQLTVRTLQFRKLMEERGKEKDCFGKGCYKGRIALLLEMNYIKELV